MQAGGGFIWKERGVGGKPANREKIWNQLHGEKYSGIRLKNRENILNLVKIRQTFLK